MFNDEAEDTIDFDPPVDQCDLEGILSYMSEIHFLKNVSFQEFEAA